MLPPNSQLDCNIFVTACKGEFNMNMNIEELTLCLMTLAKWIFEIAKFCFISGIILAVLGLAVLGLIILLRSKNVEVSRKVR